MKSLRFCFSARIMNAMAEIAITMEGMKTMKKMLALLTALLLALGLCGAYAENTDVQEDVVLASAYNGEITVKLSEVKEEFDAMLQSYISYYAQYGYEMDEYDVEFQESVAQETIQLLLSQRIAERHAQQTGYELTAEKEAEQKAQAEEALAQLRASYESYIAVYGYEGEELTALVDSELERAGYTYEALLESAKLASVLDHLYVLGTEGVTVTEEEAKADYEAKIAGLKETYDADPDSFVNAYLSGEAPAYTPEGMRLLHCIYIALEADGQTTEAEEGADPATLTGLAKANAVLAKIRAGESFDELMLLYNEDTSTPEQMEAGYPASEGCLLYGDEYIAAAMALEKIGDVSDVVVTDYGYFIIEYASDMTAGAPDFEACKEQEMETALTDKQNEAYSAYIDGMLNDSGIIVEDLSPLFHVYVSETVEATIAYATNSAETALTDMPGGDAVATLAAGTSMDVLGVIEVDGTAYNFVAVPGTAFKGYVKAADVVAMEEAQALSQDNTALVTEIQVEGKKPTFTVAMNDGSLVYGELYPEIAPESVGNFVSLANSNFYDGVIFHRVIPGFMIQGGDPDGVGTGGPGYAIRGEFANNGVENNLSHVRGVLSMARSSAMDSAGSQFFIMHADSDYLDGDYAAFGMVLGGMETVDVIASVPTNANDKPMTDQTMRTVYVETYGQEYPFTKLED